MAHLSAGDHQRAASLEMDSTKLAPEDPSCPLCTHREILHTTEIPTKEK